MVGKNFLAKWNRLSKDLKTAFPEAPEENFYFYFFWVKIKGEKA